MEEHIFEGCYCTGENCGYDIHEIEEWVASEEDTEIHTGICTKCEETIEEGHYYKALTHDEVGHWYVCKCGLVYEETYETHNINPYWDPYSGTHHYKYCDTCSYQIIENHVDENADAICDKCEDEIHICIDEDGDHICDECQEFIEELCTDENGDHTCDGENCGEKMEWLCADENGDHTCDNEKCQRHMKELCSGENGIVCDVCDRNFCAHDYLISCESLDDGTHSGVCYYCREDVIEDCYVWEYIYDEEKHYERCVCEYVLDEAEHTFEVGYIYKTSVTGHWLGCDDCAFEKHEEHKFSEGECICGTEENEVHDIYVGGKALENGEYIDNEGNITTQKPAGGYAYYKDGVLELNNYEFTGKGVLSLLDIDLLEEQYAAVFATRDLTIKLVGENTIVETSTDDMEDIYGNSVFVIGDLTIEGEGKLSIPEGDDGIEVHDGTVTLKEGNVEIGTAAEAVTDDGLDIQNGNLVIDGGYLNVYSEDHGADAEGNFSMKKGTALITAGDDGLNIMRDIKVSGGQMRVDAEDYGFDSEDGSIFVSGGEIYMTTNDEDGFDSGKKIEISGGSISIDATEDCFEAPKVTITGGSLELVAGKLAIDSDETIIDEMMEVFDSEDELIEDPDFAELDYAKIIKTETEHDWGEAEYTWAEDGSSCVATRVCKNDGNHKETVNAKVASKAVKEATCEEKGETEYTATFDVDWAEKQTKTLADIDEKGHDWGEAEYTWAADGSSCVATRVCKNDGNHKETAEATEIKSETTKEPACEEKGETTYTATFGVDWAEKQTKTIADIDEKGHDWGEAEYTWAADGSSCVAERVCKNDGNHKETVNAKITSKVVKEAACEEEGKTEYTATFDVDWAEKQTRTLTDIGEKGHDWGEAEYSWAEDGSSCTATRVCKNDGNHKETAEATEIKSATTKEPACEEKGETTYTATFGVDWAEKQTKAIADIDEKGHDWGEAEYTWAADGSSCVATRVCKNDGNHKETVNAKVTSKVVKEATCEEKGETEYTATFDVDWAEKQTRTLADIGEKGHDWGEAEYSWAEDGSSCTATRVCKNDGNHKETANATEIKSATTKEPTCEEKGETTYTATFDVDWAEKQTKAIADIDEKGHDWGEAEYTWAADGSSCTATRVCKNDGNHKETVNAKVTSKVVKEATCEEKGETEYTATFDVDWAEEQTKTLADIGEKGHDWGEAEYTWAEDGSSCVATRVCKNDGNHKETANATEIKSEVAKPATCTTMGDTRYEAVFAVDWAHDFKAITDIAVDEDAHEWGEWEVVTEPDYENEGLEKRVCNLDDKHSEEKEIAKLTVKPEETEKVEGPDDTREYVVVYQEGVIIVPDGLNVTVQDIRKDLWNAVKGGSLKGDVKVTFGEASIGYFNDKNEFVPVESDEFFKDGKTIDIVLRYPEGSDRNDKFEVYHYRDDGKVENCRIKSKTEKGLMITVDHLSPFAIAYESVDNSNNERPNVPSRPGKPSVKPDTGITIIAPEKEESNPNTGAPVVDFGGAGIVVLAAAAMFIGKKNK